MKKILVLYIILFCTNFVFPQDKNTGTVIYNMKWYKGQSDLITAKLFFNDTASLYIYNKVGYDSIQEGQSITTDYGKQNQIDGIYIEGSEITKTGTHIYRNYNQKKLLLFENSMSSPFIEPPHTTKDYWGKINWEILDIYKTILGYKVQKAIGKYRGRTYVAWFTRDISNSYGPWKLFGLPGLILEAHDITKDGTRNTIIFKAKDICFPCKKSDRKISPPKALTTKNKLEKVFIMDYLNEVILININMKRYNKPGVWYQKSEPTTPELIKAKRKRNLEVQYEWEDFPGDTPNPYGPEFNELMKIVNDKEKTKEYFSNETSKKLPELKKLIIER